MLERICRCRCARVLVSNKWCRNVLSLDVAKVLEWAKKKDKPRVDSQPGSEAYRTRLCEMLTPLRNQLLYDVLSTVCLEVQWHVIIWVLWGFREYWPNVVTKRFASELDYMHGVFKDVVCTQDLSFFRVLARVVVGACVSRLRRRIFGRCKGAGVGEGQTQLGAYDTVNAQLQQRRVAEPAGRSGRYRS